MFGGGYRGLLTWIGIPLDSAAHCGYIRGHMSGHSKLLRDSFGFRGSLLGRGQIFRPSKMDRNSCGFGSSFGYDREQISKLSMVDRESFVLAAYCRYVLEHRSF